MHLRAIAADSDGHALATDGTVLVYFDGRRFRSVDVAELTRIDVVTTIGPGSYLVGGRTRAGAARLHRVTCEGSSPLPLDASGTILAAAVDDDDWIAIVGGDGRTFAIDARGRVRLESMIGATHVGRFGEHQWLVAGEGDTGLIATFDAGSRAVRSHATPLRRSPSSVAIAGADVFLGGHHGVLVTARRTLDAPRLSMTREQLPTTLAPAALAASPDGPLLIAVGNELLVRDAPNVFQTAYRDDAAGTFLALAPGRRRLLGFLADGRVVEGRALAD